MTSRALSCFFAREFFWLYLETGLDRDRRTQVEEHLAHCGECTVLFKRLKTSKNILEELSRTKPTAEVIDYIQKEHRFWDETFQNLGLTNSISTIKWVAQLSVVGVALIITIHLFPWLNLAQSLKSMRPSNTRMAPEKKAQLEKPPADENQSQNQGQGLSASPTPPTALAETAPKPTPAFIGPLLPTPEEREAMVRAEKAKQALAQQKNSGPPGEENDEGSASDSAAASTDAGSRSKQSGFVWRGSLKVEELSEEVRDRVSKLIADLGGKKAGQVELGWHQGSNYYYHFILPEDNYEKLLNQLNAEGFVQLIKEKHPRLIKSGYMRIIMILDEDENQNEAH